jgi:hypothetical protein
MGHARAVSAAREVTIGASGRDLRPASGSRGEFSWGGSGMAGRDACRYAEGERGKRKRKENEKEND